MHEAPLLQLILVSVTAVEMERDSFFVLAWVKTLVNEVVNASVAAMVGAL